MYNLLLECSYFLSVIRIAACPKSGDFLNQRVTQVQTLYNPFRVKKASFPGSLSDWLRNNRIMELQPGCAISGYCWDRDDGLELRLASPLSSQIVNCSSRDARPPVRRGTTQLLRLHRVYTIERKVSASARQ